MFSSLYFDNWGDLYRAAIQIEEAEQEQAKQSLEIFSKEVVHAVVCQEGYREL